MGRRMKRRAVGGNLFNGITPSPIGKVRGGVTSTRKMKKKGRLAIKGIVDLGYP